MAEESSRIGRYEILETAGRGAMGVVYRARDPLIGRTVAIKVVALSPLFGEEERKEFRERFFREARAAGNLHHPNIVTIYDVGEWEGIPYMAQEFVEGKSLSRILKEQGRLDPQEAISILKQVADALDYAHAQGVVHRDIKPDNILVEPSGRAVLTDFGVARLAASDLTRTGEVLGTPHFMSPEQVTGEAVDGRSDLFSLGVVLYLMVSGQRPFQGETISSVCYQIVHAPPRPLPEASGLRPALQAVLDRLLAKAPAERFATGRELREVLEAIESETRPQEARPAEPAPALPEPPSRPREGTVKTAAPPSGKTMSSGAPKGRGANRTLAWVLGGGLVLILLACILSFVVGSRLARKGGPAGAGPVPPPEGTRVTPPAEASEKGEKPSAPPPEKAPPRETAPKKPERKPPPPPKAEETVPLVQAPAEPPKVRKGHLGLIVEGPLTRGEFRVYADGDSILRVPFLGLPDPSGRRREGFRLIQHVALPPGPHTLRFEVASPPPGPFYALADQQVSLEPGERLVLKIEPKRMPARLKVTVVEDVKAAGPPPS